MSVVWRRERTFKPPRVWPPAGGPHRDERLAFLALAPHLSKRDLRAGVFRTLFSDTFGSNYVNPKGNRRTSRRAPRHIAFASDEAAAKLDALERQRLRQTGELPKWFVIEVKRLAQKR